MAPPFSIEVVVVGDASAALIKCIPLIILGTYLSVPIFKSKQRVAHTNVVVLTASSASLS